MASFLAQCPECLTSFRVSDTQLDAAAGMVRCGACLSVFSAPSNRITIRQPANPGQGDEPDGGSDIHEYASPGPLPATASTSTQPPSDEDDDVADLWMEHVRDRDVQLGDFDLELEAYRHGDAADFQDDDDDDRLADEAGDAIEEYADEDEPEEIAGLDDVDETDAPEEFARHEELEIDGLDDHDETDAFEESDELEAFDEFDEFEEPDEPDELGETDEPERSDEPDEFEHFNALDDSDEPDDVEKAHPAAKWQPSDSPNEPPPPGTALYELPELSEAEEEAGFAEIAFHGGVFPVPPGRQEPRAEVRADTHANDREYVPPVSPGRNPPPKAVDRRELQDYLAALDDEDALEPLPEAALASFTDEPVTISAHQQARRRRMRFILLMLASLLLFGLLALQYVHANVDTFMRSERLAPLMKQLCKVLECPVPERGVLGSFSTQDLLVRSHPRFAGALEVSFVFSNDAATEQPFPAIELAFSDLDKRLLANRLFQPADYLPAELRQVPAMRAQSTLQVTLELADPGNNAVNWSLDFRQAAR